MKVVGIHGIAHTHLTAPEIERAWLPSIQGGLEEAGFPRISAGDFGVAAYGALFRSSGNRAGELPKLRVEDVQEWEAQLLLEWWREAATLSIANRVKSESCGENLTIQCPDFEGRGATPMIVQRALRQLSKSKYFTALGGERAVLFLLKQVRCYLHDLEMKRAVQKRLFEKVTPETRVIIAHSLGTVVAYECLCAHPEWNVQTFVTLGSPLGMSPIIFDALTPAPQVGKGSYPYVQQWFNVADQGDIVALEKKLAPKFGSVVDCLVHNGWESHSVNRYLNAKETGCAIATGLFEL